MTVVALNTMLVTLLIVPVAVGPGAIARAEALPLNAYAGFSVIAIGLILIDGRLPLRLLVRSV